MRHAVAAHIASRAFVTKDETMSRTPAPPDEVRSSAPKRRRASARWTLLTSLWKATHAGG
jgi:hypothetical protein